jgi:RimJ/RimL family protein N-acetyltransferase
VIERSSGELAAAITLWLHGRVGELGYWAAPSFRGRGYVPRAVQLLCAWGFDELDLPRMQLGTFPGNVASERVAEKSGFVREGVLRSWLEQRGERRDVTMWSRLPGDPA